MNNTKPEIPDTVYYFEDWNNGLGRKYIITPDFSKPIMGTDKDGKEVVTGYMDKRTEVPRKVSPPIPVEISTTNNLHTT